ncbi:ATP-binding protein [Denitromonas ohlonensis]|uniref:histidine kinase n=2 Tax=Denitromonas TaxID=139331 RepID=A0A557S649_9RHOO|nr:ATP-binding protein [Denitromonas ohlonensis]TVO68738.1 HDOD domain-containing protein [Denitromonas ohlonensis]TVO72896.1 HDOD domain-containing protein [Denitromonas ohlonensis]
MSLPVLPFRMHRPSPHPNAAEALLRLMEAADIPWDTLAEHASRDAALCFALLWLQPLDSADARPLQALLADRLRRVGAPLLRAWLLHASAHPGDIAVMKGLHQQALLTAESAMHLAIEKRYPRPEEAFLAGLWSRLGQMNLHASSPDYAQLCAQCATPEALRTRERQRFDTDHIALSANLAQHCQLPRPVIDALALAGATEEQLQNAHPLAAILRAAQCLSDDSQRLDEAQRLSGLSKEALLSLQTDVDYLSSQGLQSLGIGQPAGSNAVAPTSASPDSPRLPAHWRRVTIDGLIQAAFNAASAETAVRQLQDAFRLLFGKRPPMVLRANSEVLLALDATHEAERASAIAELDLRLSDETSVVALAMRTQTSTSHFPGRDAPGRSTRDWHIARWLDSAGILCLPWHAGGERGVGVLGIDESLDIAPDEQSLMLSLVAHAAASQVRQAQRQAAEAQLLATARAEHLAKARRITHEVNSPLTVIKSYLGIISQRDTADTALTGELAQVSKEIDRIGALLRRMSDPDTAEPVTTTADLGEVVRQLQQVYADTLFSSRKRELDVRIPRGLPAVAMPASALKQVVLNLMRNAAEALPEGGRLSISSPGVLMADGVPSLELRLVDNGPGLPDARLGRLFSPQPSQKGEDHQGIGLSIVNDLLRQSGAYTLCRSQKNTGTSFQIFIPLARNV